MFINSLMSSGNFTRLSEIVPYEDASLFDVASYMEHLSMVSAENSISGSFGQTLLLADTLPTTMKILDG